MKKTIVLFLILTSVSLLANEQTCVEFKAEGDIKITHICAELEVQDYKSAVLTHLKLKNLEEDFGNPIHLSVLKRKKQAKTICQTFGYKEGSSSFLY